MQLPPMPASTLSEKGQIVIPLEIRQRYELTPGTQVEFVDDGGVLRLVVRRRVAPSDPEAGFGLVRAAPSRSAKGRKLSSFDPASIVARKKPAT